MFWKYFFLDEYFDEENKYYDEYLVQEKIDGFTKYGEIKTFWIDGKLSYAVNTPGATSGRNICCKK